MDKYFTINEIKGQNQALGYLKYYLAKQDTIPPLLIFHGPDSTGKWFAAERFIRHILCQNGNSCGECMSCKLFMKNSHPDFIQFPVGKNIAIGEEKDPEEYTVRWLQTKRIPYRPHLSGKRIILIPDASLINNEAETALLKTLEEAPEHTRFIFLVNDLAKIKETIISRAILVKFQFLSQKAIKDIHTETGIVIEKFYGGSIRPFHIPEDVIEKVKEQINERTESTVNLLVLENWIQEYKNNHPEWEADFDYTEFLDFFTLYLIYEYTKKDYEKNTGKIEEIFHFKTEIHKNITNLDHFLMGKLFHKLMQLIN